MSLTPEQREERTAGLGGSDALAYCGKDPRCTPLDLYFQKTEPTAVPEPVKEDPRKDWGSRLEPVVRDWLSEQIGRRIHPGGKLYRSTELPFLIGHLDGITENPMEGCELKTADKFMAAEFGDVGTDQVPVRYILQVTHYMIVTRLRRFHLGALIAGNDARHYVIDYDPDLAAMMIERATGFWRHVETHTPPDPVTLADTDRRWPQSHERTVVATDAVIHAVGELNSLRAAQAEAEKKADAIEVTLKAFMGDADVLADMGQHRALATWRTQTRERFDVKGFGKEHPDMLEQYRASSSFRVFRLK